MTEHPEVDKSNLLEPTIGEQIRFEDFRRGLSKLDSLDELRELATLLAKQAMVIQPATIRYLAKEAARNLVSSSGMDWSQAAETIRDHLLDG